MCEHFSHLPYALSTLSQSGLVNRLEEHKQIMTAKTKQGTMIVGPTSDAQRRMHAKNACYLGKNIMPTIHIEMHQCIHGHQFIRGKETRSGVTMKTKKNRWSFLKVSSPCPHGGD